jgi:hypothetical protein
MSEDGKQPEDAGSKGIPERESPGGVPEPSREVSQTDHPLPVPEGIRPANEELEWARKHVSGRRTVRKPAKSVFRKTELLGIAPPSEPDTIKKARQRTLKSIRDPDGDVAYRPFEDAFRDFVCSLVERQNNVYDEMLLHAADLQQRIDALESRIEELRQVSPGAAEAKG